MKSCEPEPRAQCCAWHRYRSDRKWNKMFYPPGLRELMDWVAFTQLIVGYSKEYITLRVGEGLSRNMMPTIAKVVEAINSRHQVLDALRQKAEAQDVTAAN